MARVIRSNLNPGWFHCLNRGVDKKKIFYEDSDYRYFNELMTLVAFECSIELGAYCLMPNHWHLVVRCDSIEEMSAFFKKLSNSHAKYLRSKYGTIGQGSIYQGRYKSIPISSDRSLERVCDYVENNPVTANLVNDPRDWIWSSARGQTGTVRGLTPS